MTANIGDYVYNNETGTMWTFNRTSGWTDSEVKNPSDLIPKSTTAPKKDSPVASIGVE
jgi:hypothetical protein